MSGSAALASARKRRSAPTGLQNEITETPKPQTQTQSVQQQPTTPAALLLKHNQMINTLQNDVDSLKTNFSSMKVAPPVENKVDRESIEFFKTQYTTLLDEMKELKRTLLKVQSFSMETNLEVMKLKRVSKLEEETELPNKIE
uniref:Uncharacterized protein n=1 Tax=viral metagenome TaxID=1070528 RepID=A0A6C0JLF9_9ZZZZ